MNTISTDTHQATPQLPSRTVLRMMEVALEAAREIMSIGTTDLLEPRRQEAAILVTAIVSAVDTLSRGNMSALGKPDGS